MSKCEISVSLNFYGLHDPVWNGHIFLAHLLVQFISVIMTLFATRLSMQS